MHFSLLYTHTHAHTHTRTHAHTHTFLWKVGTSHRRNGFYTVQTVSAIALHLNLSLTEYGVFLPYQKKLWLQHILKSGDKGQCPRKSPSPSHTGVIIQIYVLVCHINARTHAHTHNKKKYIQVQGWIVGFTDALDSTHTNPTQNLKTGDFYISLLLKKQFISISKKIK